MASIVREITSVEQSKDERIAAAPLSESVQRRLIAKFGEELLREGFDAMPKRIKRNCRQANMTPTEYFLMDIIWSYWYEADHLPWPSVETIARTMGKSTRQVQRYLKRMTEKGFLSVVPRHNTHAVQIANYYDFSPLFEKILTLDTSPLPSQNVEAKNSFAKASNRMTISSEIPMSLAKQYAANDRMTSSSANTLPLANETVLTVQSSAQASPKEEANQEELYNKSVSSNLSSLSLENNGACAEMLAAPRTASAKQSAYQRMKQRALELLNGQPIPPLPELFARYVADFSATMHDERPKSTLSQVATIYVTLASYGIYDDGFITMLYDVRAQTLQAPIEKRTRDGQHTNRMAYFVEALASCALHTISQWDEEDRGRHIS
ncbi:MAG: helix-turn-helix domain-containing protein [Ktedonobacteraceae bacterium]|nr:helix-turn-helix domain-containing protein [Ktedonobacteraceae bacterium]